VSAVITWQDVLNVAPELSVTPAPMQTAVLAMVADQVPEVRWHARQATGQAYLAAHLATLTGRRGNGPVSSQSAGGLSQSYVALMEFGAIGLTSYGVEFARLLNMLPEVRMGYVP